MIIIINVINIPRKKSITRTGGEVKENLSNINQINDKYQR